MGSLPIKTNAELTKKGRGAMDGCTHETHETGYLNDKTKISKQIIE